MLVTQIATLMNTYVLPNILGEGAVANEDLSNIVDIGIQIGNANAYDKYIGKVVNVIGKVEVVDRILKGSAPTIQKESWLYGSILEQLSFDLPDAIDNDAYKLTNGNTYNQDTFYAPSVNVSFYNDKVTRQIPMSFLANGSADDRITQSFASPEQCQAFWSGIELAIKNRTTLDIDALSMRCINYYIGKQMYEDLIAGLSVGETVGDVTGVRCINLLKLYNTQFAQTLQASKALTDKDFLRFATYKMVTTKDRLNGISTLFNMAGAVRQTLDENLHVVMLSDFERAADMYLASDVFHDSLIALPRHTTMDKWQGEGTAYDFDSVSSINIKVKALDSHDDPITPTVNVSGILAVMFDDYACNVVNEKQTANSHYNAKADFINTFYNLTLGMNNMYNQNFVVFYIADPSGE